MNPEEVARLYFQKHTSNNEIMSGCVGDLIIAILAALLGIFFTDEIGNLSNESTSGCIIAVIVVCLSLSVICHIIH